MQPTINPASAPRPRRERGLSSKIALTSGDVQYGGYLLVLKIYQHSIKLNVKVSQTTVICSPVAIILLNSGWRLIKVCFGSVRVLKFQSGHVKYGNPLAPRVLRNVIVQSLIRIERAHTSYHYHLASLCSMTGVTCTRGIRCVICSKPAKGRQ